MGECAQKIKELETEKRDILSTAQFVSFRVSDEFKDKSEREDILHRLQQWRRARVTEIDKEIQELKRDMQETVTTTSSEATQEQLTKERPPTPHPTGSTPPLTSTTATPTPTPPELLQSLFSAGAASSAEQVQVYSTPLQLQPPLSSGSCTACPGCGATRVWECTCDSKQWIKDFTAA